MVYDYGYDFNNFCVYILNIMIKRDDKVYCYNEHIVKEENYSFTKDVLYNIVYIHYNKGVIFLNSNEGFTISFDYPDEYNNHFLTIKQLRKKKLEKLEKLYD